MNTGGTALNAQELRNSIYGGPFNDLIVELADEPLFCKMWQIPEHGSTPNRREREALENNETYKQMIDCQIVLRFFAFRERQHVSGSIRSMLDGCMERNRYLGPAQIKLARNDFLSRLTLVHDIFGPNAFRLPVSENNRYSRPLSDAVMIACDRLWGSASKLKSQKLALRTKLAKLLASPKSYAVIVGRPNTSKALLGRIKLVENALKSAL